MSAHRSRSRPVHHVTPQANEFSWLLRGRLRHAGVTQEELRKARGIARKLVRLPVGMKESDLEGDGVIRHHNRILNALDNPANFLESTTEEYRIAAK